MKLTDVAGKTAEQESPSSPVSKHALSVVAMKRYLFRLKTCFGVAARSAKHANGRR